MRRTSLPILLPALVLLTGVLFAGAAAAAGEGEPEGTDVDALRQEIQALKKGQDEVLRRLAAIEALLERNARGGRAGAGQAAPLEAKLDLAGAPFQGEADAPITIVELADFQCPFCARHVRDTLPRLEEDFVATGKVKYVALSFPLPNHPQGFPAAVAAHCAQEQGHYWEASRALFANFRELSPEKIRALGAEIGLEVPKFETCLESGRYDDPIDRGKRQAMDAGVTGTPTFLIGYTKPGSSELEVVEKIRGAQPYSLFASTLERLLKAKAREGKSLDGAHPVE